MAFTLTGHTVRMAMTFQDAITVFARREKCFVSVKGHNTDAKYVVSQNGSYVTACGDHLTRGIGEVLSRDPGANRIDVRVWVKP